MVASERKLDKDKGDHKVTFTLTVALAFPTDDNELPKPVTRGIAPLKAKRKLFEAPKPHYYYHLEYKLFPTDTEPIKADVVTYDVAAKIYSESDSKVLKTWRDGDKMWVTWTHSHTATVTKDVLLQLFSHSMELKIWDTKDKVSPRARFDRPKAFRLPASRGPEESESSSSGGVQQLVLSQQESFENNQPKDSRIFAGDASTSESKRQNQTAPRQNGFTGVASVTDANRAITAPSTFRSLSLTTTPSTATGVASMVKVQVRVDDQDTSQFSRLATLAGVSPPITEADLQLAEQRQLRSQSRKEKSHSKPEATTKKKAFPKSNASKKDLALTAAHTRVHGTATLCVKMYTFFSGVKSTTTKLGKAAGNIEELLLSVSLDNDLLSEIQKRELNPMVIKVSSASELPNKPLPYMELREKCKPAYVSYQFYKQPVHQSTGRQQGSDVFWEDVNVILLGTLDKGGLAEYLQGPHFQVEVHDRDRKIEQKKPKPSLFGENPEDEMINNVSLVAGRRTTHNPFSSRDKPWDPYGIAKFDLSGLLLGQKYLHLRSPIHCCPLPDTHSGLQKPDGPIVGQPGNVDGPEDKPMPVANYLEHGSELKVKVDLAYPLNAENSVEPTATKQEDECPFGRIIYMFEYKNAPFLRQLQLEITAVNAGALELDTLPQHVIEAALSTYKLSRDQRKSKTLDIITGFQVLDGQYHVFVLEGLANEGIQKLWDKLPRPQEEDITKFNVLYNSALRFHERLYAALDVDLCRVRLHEPLEVIVQNPLLYVRDLVPKPCFEALAKLDQMLRVTKLREVTRNDLFPSADMIVSMSREFGVPLTAEDFGELESSNGSEMEEAGTSNRLEDPRPKTTRSWTPLSLYNTDYVALLKEREGQLVKHDFVKENIMRTRTTEPKRRPHTIAVDMTDLHQYTAHNYSIQTLNSTELAKEKLREVLAREKDRRFTYCPLYNSATVLPIHPETVKKRELTDSKALWRTNKGFIFPGKKTSMVSNVHPKKPDSARVDELNKPWKENILHANILKPTVDRENFPWEYRDSDLNLLSVPPPFFDKNPVLSVHAAGDTKEQEQSDAALAFTRQWREKIVVDDIVFRTHRSLPETELEDRGPRASNQLSKLEGLLKNSPKKLSLSRAGLTLEEIPSLGVVANPNVDTPARKTGRLEPIRRKCTEEEKRGFYPGPFEKEGWLLERNKVPIADQEHEKFKSLKGHDFRLYYKDKDILCRRPIEPLTDEERNNHLFPVVDICS